MPIPSKQASDLFHRALEVSPEHRDSWLMEHCTDPLLIEEVRTLLEADAGAEGFLDQPLLDSDQFADAISSQDPWIGKTVGNCRIESVLGSGGMATVYSAHQLEPSRTVAVKLLDGSLTRRGSLERFRREADILAKIQHPGVASVYEVGIHEEGAQRTPYFTMELIERASPITEHARRERLTFGERLKLFVQVCEAIDHGHRKGVVHRDLKPQNILVGADHNPKVIDFGVASLGEHEPARDLLTVTGELLGTLQYMSPEQCSPESTTIDARADVYALGVVLYELICERLPYEIGTGSVLERVQRIQTEPPLPPRRVDPGLPRDFETIVLKALEKEPNHRYAGVGDLGLDLDRIRRGDPILARAPSTHERIRRFAHRYRAIVTTASVIIATLILALALVIHQASQEAKAREEAELEAERHRATSEFFGDLLREETSPFRVTLDRPLSEFLEVAAQRLDTDFGGGPDAEAELRVAIGQALMLSGKDAEALPQLERGTKLLQEIRGRDDQASIEALTRLARCHIRLSREAEAIELSQQAAELALDALPTGSFARVDALRTAGTAQVFSGSLTRALTYLEQAREEGRSLDVDAQALIAAEILMVWIKSGKREKAVQLVDEQWPKMRESLGPTTSTASLSVSIAAGLIELGRPSEAKEILTDVMPTLRTTLGEDHPRVLGARVALASSWSALGQHTLALPEFRELLPKLEQSLGPRHRSIANTQVRLAWSLHETGQDEEAERLYWNALRSHERKFGEDSPKVAHVKLLLAQLLCNRGKPEDARRLIEDALACPVDPLDDSAVNGFAINDLAVHEENAGRSQAAEELFQRALFHTERKLGPDHQHTMIVEGNLIRLRALRYGLSSQQEEWRSILERKRSVLGEAHPTTAHAFLEYADVLRMHGRFAEALENYREYSPIRVKQLGVNSGFSLWYEMLELDLRHRAGEDCVDEFRKLFERRSLLFPGEYWTRRTALYLCEALLRAGELDELEELALATIEKEREQEAPEPEILLFCLLYQAQHSLKLEDPENAEVILDQAISELERSDPTSLLVWERVLGARIFETLATAQYELADDEGAIEAIGHAQHWLDIKGLEDHPVAERVTQLCDELGIQQHP